MDERLTRYLDGEVGFSELPPRLRDEARRWHALAEEIRDLEIGAAPAGLEGRVMSEVEAGPAVGAAPAAAGADAGGSGAEAAANPVVRGLRWLVRPREVSLPPAVPLAAAAGLALWLVVGPLETGSDPAQDGRDSQAEQRSPAASIASSSAGSAASAREDAPGAASVYVEFTLEAPEASGVAVAGDFTDWEPSVRLQDRDGDGVWSGRVPLQPGIHEYMFVVDGERWITDPHAERYARDGFGNRNAVLTIAHPSDGSRGGA